MRVCHIITTLVYGGAEMLLLNSCNLGKSLRDDTDYLIIYFKEEPALIKQFNKKIKIVHIPLSIFSFKKIKDALKKFKPDIVHTHLGHADFIGLLAAKNLKAKLFCTMHNIYFKHNYYDNLIFLSYRILFRLVKKATVISISKSVLQHVEKTLKVPLKRSKLIYNGIVPSTTQKLGRNDLEIDENDFLILFVGRLSTQKNISLLLDSVKILSEKIPNLKLVIIGAGPLEKELKEQSRNLKIDSIVSFLGTTQYPENYFKISDIFVLPSIFEGFGLVIVEAFRSKCAVVASNIEGPKELIRHNENGLLFENNNVDSLVKNIHYLYQNSGRRELIGNAGFIDYDSKYRIEKYDLELARLYEK